MMSEANLKALRRTITPYVGQTLILAGVTAFCAYVAFKKSEWEFLWVIALIWALFGLYVVLFGLKYRVLWDGSGVVMRASGGPERRIQFDEVSEIDLELGASQSRPFRRLVVYGDKGNPDEFVDVSLRHFRLEDIRELVEAIRAHRPDLALPVLPMN
jgi:hypothetical protein